MYQYLVKQKSISKDHLKIKSKYNVTYLLFIIVKYSKIYIYF
jgi:hypothetical protein